MEWCDERWNRSEDFDDEKCKKCGWKVGVPTKDIIHTSLMLKKLLGQTRHVMLERSLNC